MISAQGNVVLDQLRENSPVSMKNFLQCCLLTTLRSRPSRMTKQHHQVPFMDLPAQDGHKRIGYAPAPERFEGLHLSVVVAQSGVSAFSFTTNLSASIGNCYEFFDIDTSHSRDVQRSGAKEVALQGEDDTSNSIPILFREQVHVGPVGNPILCYGRLFENDWEIVKSNGEPFLRHSSGVQVPIHMRGRSLFIHGEIRKIEKVASDAHAIRAIKITRPSALAELPSGWHWWNGFRVCHTMQKKCVDPRDDEHGSQMAYRTIMMKYDDCWRILEMSEDWRRMHDNDLLQAISPKYRECLTVMSANPLATSDLQVELMLHTATAASSQESSDRHVPPGQQEHVVGEHHGHESAFEFPREEAVAPELLVASDSADVGEHVALLPVRMEEYTEDGSFTIEGVTVAADSATRVLRAACKALGISQSGGKVKLFSKIQAYFDQKRIELTKEAAMKAKTMNERIPSTSPLAELPSNQDEIEKHTLTHLPFQPWCAACVMARGRQDQHRSDETRRGDREIPTVSMDFCYTGYSDNSAGGQEETEESEKDKLCCLVLHDSGTNNVHAVPVDENKHLHFLTGEVMRFISWLGHGECILHSDQEPVLLRLQTLVQDARLKAGLKTIKENPAVKSHASNSLVENSIQRIRNMSNTILHSLREKTALKFGCQQALTSWSWHHAAWLINDYAPNHGQTGYELLTGHGYRGKVSNVWRASMGIYFRRWNAERRCSGLKRKKLMDCCVLAAMRTWYTFIARRQSPLLWLLVRGNRYQLGMMCFQRRWQKFANHRRFF